MKRILAIATLAALTTMACGSIEGNDPIGVTGGGENGYGGNGDRIVQWSAQRLTGRWWTQYYLEDDRYLTLNADGTAGYKFYDNGELIYFAAGVWRADGHNFIIEIPEFSPRSGGYNVRGDSLFLYAGELAYHYIRDRD